MQKSGALPPLPSYLDLQDRQPSAQQQNLSVPDNNPLPLPPSSSLDPMPAPHSDLRDTTLRIASQPVDSTAAEAQARFAAHDRSPTDAGLSIPDSRHRQPHPAGTAQYARRAQYTPSAQDAAAGAYSAPRQPGAQPQTQPTAAPPAQPKPAAIEEKGRCEEGNQSQAQPAFLPN